MSANFNGGIMETNKKAMYDDLIDSFIEYQWRLDNPYPIQDETKEMMITKYRTDPIFNCKVQSMVSGIMHIIGKHI
jgi:hypothetical protein